MSSLLRLLLFLFAYRDKASPERHQLLDDDWSISSIHLKNFEHSSTIKTSTLNAMLLTASTLSSMLAPVQASPLVNPLGPKKAIPMANSQQKGKNLVSTVTIPAMMANSQQKGKNLVSTETKNWYNQELEKQDKETWDIKVNQRQCALLVDAFNLAFDAVAGEIKKHLKFEERLTKWKALEPPLRELHRIFREGEQYVKSRVESKDWWGKAVYY